MTDNHQITPSPELIAKWTGSMYGYYEAARWGADQELEACCDHIHTLHGKHRAEWLHDIRRPKPPSLKERIAAAITAGDERTALSLLNEALPE
jgi:hypothetical protein